MKSKEITMKLMCCRLLCLACLLPTLSVTANNLKSTQAKQIAIQLQKTIDQKLAEITELELAAGTAIEDISIELSQNRRFDSGRFGAILDANQPGKIVSITPKSQAFNLGLMSGDTITQVNGNQVSATNNTWQQALTKAPHNSPLTITIRRASETLTLTGMLKGKFVPQWQLTSSGGLNDGLTANHIPYWEKNGSGPIFSSQEMQATAATGNVNQCGRIIVVNSVTISPSRHSGLKSTAVIKEVDGFQWLMDKSRLRIAVGNHQLRIGDKFDLPKDFRDFSLNVEANTNYYIVFTRNKVWVDSNGEPLPFGKYTGPVIWKTKKQACEI